MPSGVPTSPLSPRMPGCGARWPDGSRQSSDPRVLRQPPDLRAELDASTAKMHFIVIGMDRDRTFDSCDPPVRQLRFYFTLYPVAGV